MEIGAWVDGDLYNGRVVRVANSFVFKDPVFNYSSDYPFLWDEIKIPMKHSYQIDKVEKIISSCALEVVGQYEKESEKEWKNLTNKYLIENARVKHLVSVTFNENYVTYTLRYVVDFKNRRSTKDQLSRLIMNRFQEKFEDFSYPCSTVQILKTAP